MRHQYTFTRMGKIKKKKNAETPNTEKDVESPKYSYFSDGNVKWFNNFGTSVSNFL